MLNDYTLTNTDENSGLEETIKELGDAMKDRKNDRTSP